MPFTHLRFAPLRPTATPSPPAPPLRGIVFDVDGTLCAPQSWMFVKMRSVLGIAAGVDILSHVATLPHGAQDAAMAQVRDVEREAMAQMVPSLGLAELMAYLEERGIRKGILTRNYEDPVNHLLTTYLPKTSFSPIVTRAFQPPKPDPAGILHIAREWGLQDGSGLIMVGDSMDDMAAGRKAGAATVLLVNDGNRELCEHEYTDCVVDRLDKLVGVLEDGFCERSRTEGEVREEMGNMDAVAE